MHFHWYIGFPVALVLLFGAFVRVFTADSGPTTAATKCTSSDGSICPSSPSAGTPSFSGAAAIPFRLPVEEPQVAHPDRLPDQIEKLDALQPHTAWQRQIDRLTQLAQERLFASRFHGPYSISVLDRLNEMVIGTNLKAYGVTTDEAPLRLGDPLFSAIPSSMPAFGYISSPFGLRRSPFTGRRVQHNGIDIAVNHGSPIYATADGIVTLAGNRYAMGKTVVINHGFGIVTRYGHNSNVLVKAGDFVQKGQRIALSGSTGRSTGAHLHYEVWVNGEVVDPTKFMFDVPAVALMPQPTTLARSEDKPALNLGFAIGGEASSNIPSSDDWLTEISRQRQGQTVTTLFILALFSSACAILVLLAGRGLGRDLSLPHS